MPKVSIVIPALRPQFLDASIASALAQTFSDVEILVSDDSGGDDVLSVLSKWSDPRIRYSRNPNRGVPGGNRDALISQATGQYLKFLFDDDLLMPTSVEALVAAAETTHASLAFHGNHQMDSAGRMLPNPLGLAEGATAMVGKEVMFAGLLKPAQNFIGGPVNILVETAVLQAMPNAFGLDGQQMRFLTDVALYMNFVDQGHTIVGLGARLAAFRIHGGQVSNENSPVHSAGVFEWEYLVRWAADHWPIEYTECVAAIEARHEWYRHYLDKYPELAQFIELGSQADESGWFCTAAFNQVLAELRGRIDAAGSQVPLTPEQIASRTVTGHR